VSGLDSSGSGKEAMVGCCEQGRCSTSDICHERTRNETLIAWRCYPSKAPVFFTITYKQTLKSTQPESTQFLWEDGSVGIEMGYRLRGQDSDVASSKNVLFSTSSRVDLGRIQPPILWSYQWIFPYFRIGRSVKLSTHLHLVTSKILVERSG
jgi:hypothetical protein